MRVVAALLLCAGAARAEPARTVSTALFVATQATLVIDVMQTWDIARSQCPRGPGTCGTARTEMNPLLGQHPSDAAVLGYFVGLSAMHTAIYLWGPPWLSMLASSTALMIEVPTIANNFRVGGSLSLPF